MQEWIDSNSEPKKLKSIQGFEPGLLRHNADHSTACAHRNCLCDLLTLILNLSILNLLL